MAMYEKSYETDNRTGENQEGPNANRPVRRLTATSIIGDDVENPEGENLGSIKNLMINIDGGSIEYAVLQFGGFLGMGQKLFAIPWREFKLDPLREVFILNRDKDYLKSAPGFDEDHWPETNDHYYNEAYTYWGGAAVDPTNQPYPRGGVII
ncbi:MAG TPA: PRC-barrel domain-containing protein [Cytophagales bacterium]|nr:PRC-barrel domain-containing protein [Cytophagales bacterium]